MSSSKSSAGAPKKARWSTEKKAVAAKKPHRGQGPSSYSGSPSRPVSSGSSHVGGREWRAPRDEHRSSDRPARNRDDRPSYNRDDRGTGGYQRRDDRPSYNRDDRGDRRHRRLPAP